MLKVAFVAALAGAAICIATPGVTRAGALPQPEAAVYLGDQAVGIENVRWVRRCHTETRLRWTNWGRQWVPVRICNRTWVQGPRWRDRGRGYGYGYRNDRYDRDYY
jgi:hypothetical protein